MHCFNTGYSKVFLAGVITGLIGVLFPADAVEASPVLEKLLNEYAVAAKRENPAFSAFNAEAGRELYHLKRRHSQKNEILSCSTCHTENPRNMGQTTAGKPIDPLSPAANPKRLTDEEEIRKWFKRNCTQVLERECTPIEKGNFLHFLLNS